MEINIYNQQGEVIKKETINDDIFSILPKKEVIYQVVTAQLSNQRSVIAHTKGRSEVRGGGKKPWKQKGTGRARHGSIRSPLWIGGGVTFGPRKNKQYKKKVNKKVKRLAFKMCLSDKVRDQHLLVLDKLNLSKIKTKNMIKVLNKLPSKQYSTLLTIDKPDNNIIHSTANIPYLKLDSLNRLNVVDILKYKYLLTTLSTIRLIEERFQKNNKLNKQETSKKKIIKKETKYNNPPSLKASVSKKNKQ
ncbi:MAG: 50S ribosomal protein L4 [Candidatus Aenigmarchaeota archaeon]|nr:50S ribosomal protein L4 [Candidatus Aenigmarchaeota archaeon]